ncbi:MFS transporter, ACS family, D-galactonate transporter [Plantibacter flavus]|uniref:ACS family D-galactonate transporter-like MFS transporter n=1 Tax=Plantibacter flavus TaxID=150123 RepID=A0A3N2C338_9MICO|nr:MFS transporter [Plantibacter flavus]ROR81714.1 ACS family D-galactonate transporter-like MFS transporter [Plantibacter flavus]SMG15913.1 MFS transporter, ACS family, D-galactonate transporter [Plantibacter flavus]
MTAGNQRTAPGSAQRPSGGRATNIRWSVVVVLFLFYTINSIDRSSLGVAMPSIVGEFELTPTMQGVILSAFFWTYCLMQIPGGLAADRFGPRRIIGIASAVWGTFTAFAGLAVNGVMLILARLGLGAFEAPYMPAASKLVSNWMPPKRRATGVTLIDSGAPLGAAFGGLLVAWLITATGSWRWSFIIIGVSTVVIGFCVYLYIRNLPNEHRLVNRAEVELITVAGGPEEEKPGVTRANTTAMVVGRFGWAMVFWGLVTWGPSYLSNARGLDLQAMGFATFLIFFCGALGEILSGFLADRLQRVFSRNRSFKLLFGGSGALSLVALISLPFVTDAALAVTLLCIGVFFNLFGGLYWTIPAMLAKKEKVGLVGGIMNFAGTSAGIVVPIVAGVLLDVTGGYTAVLIFLAIAAAVYLAASLMINFSGVAKGAPSGTSRA